MMITTRNMSSMPNGSGGFSWLSWLSWFSWLPVSVDFLEEEKSSPRLYSDQVTKVAKAPTTNSLTSVMIDAVEIGAPDRVES